jgi:hypothetical protein
VAGYRGTAVAGEYGKATVGNYGIAMAGRYGCASAGDNGIAMVGIHGCASAGRNGVIQIWYFDGHEMKIEIGRIGEDGLEPNTMYKVVLAPKRFTKVI